MNSEVLTCANASLERWLVPPLTDCHCRATGGRHDKISKPHRRCSPAHNTRHNSDFRARERNRLALRTLRLQIATNLCDLSKNPSSRCSTLSDKGPTQGDRAM